jgi:type I restriction enzyme M protein
MAVDIHDIENRLWAIADELRANSNLDQHQYKTPVLGLIFLKHADHRFAEAERDLVGTGTGRRSIGKTDFQPAASCTCPSTRASTTC